MNRFLNQLERLSSGRFLGLTFVLLAGFRLPSFFAPLMDSDEAVRAVGAKLLLNGGVPYLDFVDNKPPLTWLLYAIAGGSVTGARILAALFTWGTALIAGLLLVHARTGTRRLATILYLLFSAAWIDRQFLTANTEVFMNLPLAAGLYFSLRPEQGERGGILNGFLCGLCFAASVLCRPTALFAAPVAAFFWFAGPGSSRDLFFSASLKLMGAVAGGLAGLGAAAGWFHLHGALKEFFYWSFLSGGEIGATGNTGADFWRRMAASFLPWALSAILLWRGFAGNILEEWRKSPAERDYGVLMLAAVTAITILPCSFGGRWRAHYYLQFLPSLVPLAAMWLESLAGRETTAEPPWWQAAIIPALALLPPLLALTVNGTNLVLDHHRERIGPDIITLSSRWEKEIPPDEAVFIWGYATGAYYLSGRTPASRYIVPVTRLSGYAYGSDRQGRGELDAQSLIDPAEVARLVADLEKNRPLEIADLSPGGLHGWGCCPMPDRLASWVSGRYTETAPAGRVTVWRRKE